MAKKYYLLILLAIGFSLNAQTILVSHPLELQKSKSDQQLYSFSNEKNLYTFASDKDSVFGFQYNSAVFLKEKLKAARPHKSFEFVAGQTISPNGIAHLYWVSEDFMKVETQSFNFQLNHVNSVENRLEFKDEKMVAAFSTEEFFYIISVLDKVEKLKFRRFQNATITETTIDFEPFSFLAPTGKNTTLNELFDEFPVEFFSPKTQHPFASVVVPIKIYPNQNNLILTFEQAAQTQAFVIDFDENSVIEKKFPKPNFEKTGFSNSFLLQNSLYQVKLNSDQLTLQATDFATGAKLNTYEVSANESIDFKNSPFLLQTEQRRPKQLKNTEKFLSRLSYADIGISAYQTPNHHLITVGGTKYVASTGSVITGISLSIVAGIATGGDSGFYHFDDYNFQSVYFESLFDKNFQHLKEEQRMLASDGFFGFLSENKINSHSYIPFQDYFVLTYHDAKTNQLMLRKFEDFKD